MDHHNPTHRSYFPFIHSLAIIIVSGMLAFGAYTKLTEHPDAVSLFSTLNLFYIMKALGVVQLIIMVTLWWRPTRIIGTLIASAYFGAGVIMMLSAGESAFLSTILLLLTWIIHKCTWWSMWHHGYHCGCKTCMRGNDILPKGKRWCDCGKDGCRCEHGKCAC